MDYHNIAITFYGILVLIAIPLGAHEAGHWAALKRYGVPVREFWMGLGPAFLHLGKFRFGMLPLGAAVVPDEEGFKALTPDQKIVVALAGPLFSFLAAAIFYMSPLFWPYPKNLEMAQMLGSFNLFIGAFNLIPFPPLDGFQVYLNVLARKNKQIHQKTLNIIYRLGNGMLYGIGFVLIAKLLLEK